MHKIRILVILLTFIHSFIRFFNNATDNTQWTKTAMTR